MDVHVTLEIVDGPQRGNVATINRSPFVVGSGVDSDWQLEDATLGRKHLEIVVGPSAVVLRSLVSDGPVWVNGRREGTEPLLHDDRIRAGANTFHVQIRSPRDSSARLPVLPLLPPAPQAPIPPTVVRPQIPVAQLGLYHFGEPATRLPHSLDSSRPMFAAPPATEPERPLLARLRPHRINAFWYGVIDAAQETELALNLTRQGYDLVSLFLGELARDMHDAAPYFFAIPGHAPALDDWVGAMGGHVGILADSAAEPSEVFRHLREIFVVVDETGQEHFFRYYDPRVLRAYLPTCTPEELAAFFGPLTAIVVENETGDGYLEFRREKSGLAQTALALAYLANEP